LINPSALITNQINALINEVLSQYQCQIKSLGFRV
jgi:hypothetical protein